MSQVRLHPTQQTIVSLDPSQPVPTVLEVKFKSLIHEIEDVSYKSKPSFFKQSAKQRNYVALDRDPIDFDIAGNMLDDDLHENLALKDVIIQVVDWIPTGANQHRQLAAEIGAGERCRVRTTFYLDPMSFNGVGRNRMQTYQNPGSRMSK
jgi:hypothetical protein